MAAQSLLAKLGMRLGTLGSAASLAVAFPLSEGDPSMAAHTSASRIGVYADRTGAAEKMGHVVMGTEICAVSVQGLSANRSGATGNQMFGLGAGNATMTGTNNTVVGAGAGALISSGLSNTAVGSSALAAILGGSNCTAIGRNALLLCTAVEITAVGSGALDALTTGTGNTAVGFNALGALGNGTFATAVGHSALAAATAGTNTAVGYEALTTNIGGNQNTAVGVQALSQNASTGTNTAVGHQALSGATATGNTAVGSSAGNAVSTGNGNILLGLGSNPGVGTLSNRFVAGSTLSSITDVFFGNGELHATPVAYTINGTGGSATDKVGGAINIAGGRGTGTGVGGKVILRTAKAGLASNNVANSLADRFAITQDGALEGFGIATASAPAVSAANNGTIYYDSTAQSFYQSRNGGAYAPLGGAVAAFYAGIGSATFTAMTGTASASINTFYDVSGTSADYDITLPTASSNVGAVVGFSVAGFAAASKAYRLDAGVGVLICGRTRYLTLVNTNAVLLLATAAGWRPLVLNLDSPWVDAGATVLTAVTSNPTKGTMSRDKVFWRRMGANLQVYYQYNQSGTVGANNGSGGYLLAVPIGVIDTSTVQIAETVTTVLEMGSAALGYGTISNGATPVTVAPSIYDTTHLRMLVGAGYWGSATYQVASSVIRMNSQASLAMVDW